MASSTVELDYTVRGPNRDFLMTTAREAVAVGAAGTGKTFAMMVKLHLSALRFPGARILLTRKVGQDLTTGPLDTYHKHVRPDLFGVKTYGGSKFLPAQYQYPNGSVIIPTGLDKSEKVMSAEYDIIACSEITNGITKDDWEKLTTRLRSNVMPYQQIIGDCNPTYVRHWLNQRMSDGLVQKHQPTHRDNPAYWDEATQDWTILGRRYLATLEGLTGVQRTRLLKGEWASAEGLVYGDFDHRTMVKKQDTTAWRRIIGVDVGATNPTVVLCAYVSGDERVHIGSMVYRPNLRSADAINKTIIDAAKDFQPDTTYIDPSAAGVIGDVRSAGFVVSAGDNRIEEGVSRVQSLIQRGALTVDPSCTPLLDEFGEYAYSSKAKAGNEKPVKEHDHAMDALRYLVMGVTKPVLDLGEFLEKYA